MDKDAIIKSQQEKIDELYDEIYTMKITGEIKPLKYYEQKKKSYKKFLKRNKDVQEYINERVENKVINFEQQFNKLKRIVKENNLDLKGVQIINQRYVRVAIFMDNIDKLLNDIVNCSDVYYTLPNGYKVKPTSLRYQTFAQNLTCYKCGIKGRFLALERCITDAGGPEGDKEGEGYHLNLYALDEMGREILMTKDHFIPKSKGGRDALDNLKTMCCKCNQEKKDTMPEEVL